jgi:hypothetical protein
MFALRGKLRAGKNVGMGEIGAIAKGLLDIFPEIITQLLFLSKFL